MTPSRVKRYVPLLALVALAAGLLIAGVPSRWSPESLVGGAVDALARSSGQPIATFAWLAGAIALMTAAGLPGAVALFAAAGFLLGVPAAMAAAALGNVVGTSALFAALRMAFFQPRSVALPDAGAMRRIREGFSRHPLAYALFLRAVPMVPNGASTAALAAVRCSWPIFLTASALGPQANAALMGWLGAQLAREVIAGRTIEIGILGDPRWWLPMLLLAGLMLLPIAFRRRTATGAVAKP